MRTGILVTLLISILISGSVAQAGLVRETVEYKDGDTVLEGYFVYDDKSKEKRPGIMVVHDWMGLGDYAKMRADMLAELGYIAFAVDIYGKDVRPKNNDEASELAGKYKANRKLLRWRISKALDRMRAHELVDDKKTGAIGYCFGGTTVLELVRSGADVTGVVSFHGGLDGSNLENARPINTKVLVLHGADDPYVPSEQLEAFMKEMNDSQVDWQMVLYADAVHSFSKKEAGNDKKSGNAYDERADRRSWRAMKNFFRDIFETEK